MFWRLFCRFFFFVLHWWETVHDTGKTVYQQCACGKRRVWQRWPGIGHQPIDHDWVEGRTDTLGQGSRGLRPPQGGSSTAPRRAV